jgi:hypothetical protein
VPSLKLKWLARLSVWRVWIQFDIIALEINLVFHYIYSSKPSDLLAHYVWQAGLFRSLGVRLYAYKYKTCSLDRCLIINAAMQHIFILRISCQSLKDKKDNWHALSITKGKTIFAGSTFSTLSLATCELWTTPFTGKWKFSFV